MKMMLLVLVFMGLGFAFGFVIGYAAGGGEDVD